MKKISIKTVFNPYTIIILTVFLFYGRLLFGEMLFRSDFFAYQLPEKLVIRECLEQGKLPLMNPYILSGSPMLNNIAVAALYPLNFLLLLGSPVTGFNIFIFTHIMLAGISLFLLLYKGFRINKWVSCLGGVSFALSGPVWFSIDKGFTTSTWLIPFFLLGLIYQFRNRDSEKKDKGLLSIIPIIALTLLFYCGNFLEAYTAVILGGISIIVHKICIDKNKTTGKDFFITISKYCLILIFSILLSAPQLYPTYIASKKSYRSEGLKLEAAQHWSIPSLRTLEYFIPFIYGKRSGTGFHFGKKAYTPLSRKKTEGSSPWFDSLFFGLPILFGIIISISAIISGLVSKNLDKNVKISGFLLSGALLFFLISLGKRLPVYSILYYILPGFKFFRHPEKFIEWTNIILILTGAFGLEKFVLLAGKKGKENLKKVMYGITVVLLLCIISVAADYYFDQIKNYALSRWQLITLSITIIAIGFMLLILSIYKNKNHLLIFCFIAITALHMLPYSFIIKWTMPEKEFEKTKVWTEALPDFDRSQWRIFSSPFFDFNGEKNIRDNFVKSKIQEYINLQFNAPAIKKIKTPSGFDAIAEKKYIDFFNSKNNLPVLDILSVKYIGSGISAKGKPPKGFKKLEIKNRFSNSGTMILENPDAVPRISLYKNLKIPVDSNISGLNTQYNPKKSFYLTRHPNLFGLRTDKLGTVIFKPGKNPKLKIIEDSPGKISLKVTGGPAWVVIRDWFSKGWICRDENGKKVPIGEADSCFMAVFADKEKKTFEFSFIPPGFNSGLITAAFAFLFLIGFLKYKTILREK